MKNDGMKISWAAVVVILAVLIYLPILKNGFVFDDHGLIERNTSIQDFSNIPRFFSTDLWSFYFPDYQTRRIHYWRPLLLTSWAAVYQVFGSSPAGFHLISILFHALATLLVFILARDFLEDERVAVASALIFAFHPVHVDAVAWASGLSDLLVALFVMATLVCYHRFRTRNSLWWGGAALILLVLALLSKENAVMTPLVLAAYEFLIAPREGRRRAVTFLTGMCLAVIAYLLVRGQIMGTADIRFPQLPVWKLIATLIVVCGHYARLLLFPFHLVATYPNKIYDSILQVETLKAFLFLFLFAIFLIAVLKRRKDVFWLFLGGLTLLPALNIIGVGPDLLAERYLYLPSVGFCVLLAQFLLRDLSRRIPPTAGMLLVGLLLVTYAVRDLTRFPDWHDEPTYLKVTLRDAPDAYIHHNNMGNYLHVKLKDLEGAQKEFETAAALAPDYEYAQSNLAIVLLERGNLHEALNHALRASEIQPKWVDPLLTAAEAAGRLGDASQAKDLLTKALALEPDNSMANNNMGNVAYMEGDLSEAVKWWKKAEELDPSNLQVLFNLALGYERLGKMERAVFYYRRFSEKAPPEMNSLKQQASRKIRELETSGS